MLASAFNFLSPRASWQQRLPDPPGVESAGMSAVGWVNTPSKSQCVLTGGLLPMVKQHQQLMMVGTVEFKEAMVELHCLPCILIPHDIAEVMPDSQLPTYENK